MDGPPNQRREARGRRISDIATYPVAHVTVQAFADYLRVQPKTVMKWIHAGILPAYRFPPLFGRWRIRRRDAIAFVERARFRAPDA